MNPTACPNCGEAMRSVYILMSGGAWLTESSELAGQILNLGEIGETVVQQGDEVPALHCLAYPV